MASIVKYLSGAYELFLYTIAFWLIVLLFLFIVRSIITDLKTTSPLILINCFLINLGFSFMGLSIGILTGWSSSPVVGVVIPALLTFYGGMVSYSFLFKKEKSSQLNSIVLSGSLISISFFLIIGTDYGTSIRVKAERNNTIIEMQDKMKYETFKHNLKSTNMNTLEKTAPIKQQAISSKKPNPNIE